MRKNSDYFANNQLLLAENVGFEKYFCEKCDFCPFLGDFRHFWILFRQGVGRRNGKLYEIRRETRDAPIRWH